MILTSLEHHSPPPGSDAALRYLRDRISVPRDMSIYAAKRLRAALESTAALAGDAQGVSISIQHRRDQDPANFAMSK
jgi:glutathione S-transferase